jgi:ubiquinone biosynthesis monooxygenase Coq7
MSALPEFCSADLAALEPSIPGLTADIRSDHAGETGAVMIYRGVLAGTRDPALRRFAGAHLASESAHLELIESLLPREQWSMLLPLWRVAGWITGYLPALWGARAVYATIEAVETFVVHHYEQQINRMSELGVSAGLRTALSACQADEARHRDDAHALQTKRPGAVLRAWLWLVDFGSRAAVSAARRL